jgi:hypothetical protein
MPSIKYNNLTAIARGYADAIVETMGCADNVMQWRDIGTNDFPSLTLQNIERDCDAFLTAAIEAHPLGEDALFEDIEEYDIGRHFYLARQGTGVGFEEFLLEDLGQRLAEIAEGFGWIDIDISDQGQIVFAVTAPSEAINPSA